MKHLNIHELMIGDYVFVNHISSRLTPAIAKIAELSVFKSDSIKTTEGLVDESLVLPVKLTEEILSDNGFSFVDASNSYAVAHGSVWTGWWIYKGLELCCMDGNKFPVYLNVSDTNVEVKYVHQLQHMLRICNINKEIELKDYEKEI